MEITFYSKRKQNIGNVHIPEPSKNLIPEWFSSADKHRKMSNGLYELITVNYNNKVTLERVPSWKSCPAILDTVISGYILKTPIDIKISKVNNEYVIDNYEECSYFCGIRGYQEGFPTPYGYDDLQFNWITNWMPKVPKGYGTLWSHPFHRFDLPFISVTGFVDTESYIQKGRMPFFIRKDFEGIIPAGTPFAQIVPVKNEDWTMNIKTYTEEEIDKNDEEDWAMYVPGAPNKSNYKTKFWVKKQYD